MLPAPACGDKAHPYEFDERVGAFSPVIEEVLSEVDRLPSAACPDDKAVVAVSLHPSYLARSYDPSGILREFGLRQVGSREESVGPMRSVRKTPITKTTELLIAGPRRSLHASFPPPMRRRRRSIARTSERSKRSGPWGLRESRGGSIAHRRSPFSPFHAPRRPWRDPALRTALMTQAAPPRVEMKTPSW